MSKKRLSEAEIETISKERPYVLEVMQSQMLYDIAGMLEEAVERLANIEALLERPKGFVYPIKQTVDKITILDFVKHWPNTLLFGITLFNDGPDEIYVGVNEHQTMTPLNTGEDLRIEYTSPRIRRLYLDVEKGKKANIRGFGIY